MLVVAGVVEIDPAKRDQAMAAAIAMMQETRREEGCRSYVFSADLEDAGRFHIFEEWESQEALDAHFASPHMAAFQGTVAKLGVRRMSVQKYAIDSVGPLR